MTLSNKNFCHALSQPLVIALLFFLSSCSFLNPQKPPTLSTTYSVYEPSAYEPSAQINPIKTDNVVIALHQEQPVTQAVVLPEEPSKALIIYQPEQPAELTTNQNGSDLPGEEGILVAEGLEDDADPIDNPEEKTEEPLLADAPEALVEIISIPEPAQTAAEEIKQLDALGQWEAGKAPEISGEFDFPVTMNKQVEFYLNFFQYERPKVFTNWLKRSGRYLPMIQQQLAEKGLPKDLAYLAMIESGFILSAYSPMHAVGLWQFIRDTGKRYKLVINKEVDERHDPVKSTKAAIGYLSDLYNEFGSWYLAVASYNAGEGKIRKAVSMYNTTDFWQIAQGDYLKTETKRYVPMLIASILIAKEPARYGFTDIDFEDPLAYDTVEVPRGTALKAVSVATGYDYDEICKLNRELRKAVTPSYRNMYPLKVPVGTSEQLLANLPRVRAVKTTEYKIHTVKKSENLAKICKKYGLSKTALSAANKLRTASVSPGTKLRIPRQTTSYKLIESTQHLAALPKKPANNNETSIIHTVKSGENPYEIAKRYGVSAQMLAAWNNLSDPRRLSIGQQLVVYPKKSATIQTAGIEPEKYAKDEALITYYHVQDGDTLWKIAQRYNISTEQIKQWNKMSGNGLQPGLRLTLKVEKGG